ncbi:MAG: response regulator [Promethearchaeota archaeon]
MSSSQSQIELDMKKFEEETGKKAIWRGKITKEFEKWRQGDKIYSRNKDRISLYVSKEIKNYWKEFIEESGELKGFSKLIRESVNEYINRRLREGLNKEYIVNLPKISHDLKEPLTSIKANSQILLEQYNEEINNEIETIVGEIFNSSILLEKKIKNSLENFYESEQYDILIVDDDAPTLKVLIKYFEKFDISCKSVLSGNEAIEVLKNGNPKIILLDILLPDLNGYELCTRIRSMHRDNDYKIFLMTAFPYSEIEEGLRKVEFEGYFLKPFEFSEFLIFSEILDKPLK